MAELFISPQVTSITGTVNQITASSPNGNVTLSLPQNIHTGASPTFVGATLSGMTAGSVIFAGVGGALSQNNANFFWDNVGNRLGIGTIAPGSQLEIKGTLPEIRINSSTTTDITQLSFFEGATINGFVQYRNSAAPTVSNILSLGSSIAGGQVRIVAGNQVESTRFDANGNVGIGGVSGGARLAVIKATSVALNVSISATVSTGLGLEVDGSHHYVWGYDNKNLLFATNNAERMRINSAGLVGIGTNAPSDTQGFGNALDLNGTTGAGYYVRFNGSGTHFGLLAQDGSVTYLFTKTDPLAIWTNSLERMRIDAAGLVGINKTNPATNLDVNGFINWNGQKRVSAQFDKTTDTALANVTGLSVSLSAGKTYYFTARLYVDANATGGHKYAISGTATATAIIYQVDSISDTTNLFVINSRQTALNGSIGQAGATTIYTKIEGTITVNLAGTLTVQFAQNAATGTSSVLVGSTFIVQEIA